VVVVVVVVIVATHRHHQSNHTNICKTIDTNRSIATLAITTLLKTGSASSVERLMKQIAAFMNDITDEFKVVVVDAIRSLALKVWLLCRFAMIVKSFALLSQYQRTCAVSGEASIVDGVSVGRVARRGRLWLQARHCRRHSRHYHTNSRGSSSIRSYTRALMCLFVCCGRRKTLD
jgi:hypothetical protein